MLQVQEVAPYHTPVTKYLFLLATLPLLRIWPLNNDKYACMFLFISQASFYGCSASQAHCATTCSPCA